jgi:CHAD domain-containing protein
MTSEQEQDFLGAVDQHWEEYRKQFKSGRRAISEESIHDLRVAAREFQALLRILQALDAHPRVKKIRRFLSKQLDQLNEVHDAQVMLQEANQRMESLPQLGPFRDYLQAGAKKLARSARKDIGRSKPSDLKERVKRVRKVARKHSDDQQLVEHLLQVVDDAYAKTNEALTEIKAADPATIHKVRIAFKEFRYMIETIRPFLPDYPESYPDRMHDYQDAMGNVRDATVFLDKLKEFEQDLQQRGHGQAPAFDSKSIQLFYQQRLEEMIQAYFQRRGELNSFWRAAPDLPFPWENNHEPVHRAPRNRRATGQQQQRRRGQPATTNRRRPKEVPDGGAGAEPTGDSDRPDTDQSLPAGG